MQLLSKDHTQNLIKLAEYILNNVSDEHFNMESYRGSVAKVTNYRGMQETVTSTEVFYSFDNCGTVGCALGWAPFALTEAEPGVRGILRKEFFDTYITAAGDGVRSADFDRVSLELFGIPSNSVAWEYLFSGEWADRENDGSREGFVERVAVYLSNPEMFKWKRTIKGGEFRWVQY